MLLTDEEWLEAFMEEDRPLADFMEGVLSRVGWQVNEDEFWHLVRQVRLEVDVWERVN